jgi:hypothetical protein
MQKYFVDQVDLWVCVSASELEHRLLFWSRLPRQFNMNLFLHNVLLPVTLCVPKYCCVLHIGSSLTSDTAFSEHICGH